MRLEARKPAFVAREQQRHRPASTSAQSDQCLCFRYLESIVVNLASCKISVPEHAGLSFTMSEILETAILALRPK